MGKEGLTPTQKKIYSLLIRKNTQPKSSKNKVGLLQCDNHLVLLDLVNFYLVLTWSSLGPNCRLSRLKKGMVGQGIFDLM